MNKYYLTIDEFSAAVKEAARAASFCKDPNQKFHPEDLAVSFEAATAAVAAGLGVLLSKGDKE